MLEFVYLSYHLNLSFPHPGGYFNKTRDTHEHFLMGTSMNFRIFIIPKKSLLKSSHPKKILAKFPYPKKKKHKVENFKPPKILRSSPSLEVPSTPPPPLPTGASLLLRWVTDLFIWLLPNYGMIFPFYSWFSRDVIKILKSRIARHLSFYPSLAIRHS